MQEVKLGKYKHYKGKFYQVIGAALHSETLEEFVVYKPLYTPEIKFKDRLWIRPKSMFLEKVNLEGKLMQRFEFVE